LEDEDARPNDLTFLSFQRRLFAVTGKGPIEGLVLLGWYLSRDRLRCGEPRPVSVYSEAMAEITELLAEARDGDPDKLGAVFELVYPDLKRLAASTSARHRGQPVTTTALVHSTYAKFIRAKSLDIRDRRHFFGCAAKAMRQIILDNIRALAAEKRGGGLHQVTLPADLGGSEFREWIDLDRALSELDEVDPDLRELVELRFFAGLTEEEIAQLRGCSKRTVQRAWRRARAFLYARLDAPTDLPS